MRTMTATRFMTSSLAMMFAVLLTSSAWAEEGSEEGSATKGDRPGRKEMRERILDEFDADGDGKLNEDERATARAEMQGRRGDRRAKGGSKGGGEARGPRDRRPDDRGREDRGPEAGRRGRGPEGRGGPERRRGPAGRDGPEGRGPGHQGPPSPEEMFERFDANGDDQLSRQEFMEMAREVREMRERHGFGGPPPRGDRGERGDRGPRSGRRDPSGDRRPSGDRDEDRRPERPRPPRPEFDTSDSSGPALPKDETT